MITTQNQDVLARWLCERVGYMPTPHIRCIGNVNSDGKILGVVGFDGWNGASCQMHVAGEGNWVTRQLLFAGFDYPFNVAGCRVVLGLVPSGNDKALRFDKHVGFREVARIKDAHPDGELIVLEMRRENCRYLRKQDGQEVISAAA
jgi:RimJ/RimL family protein N-acetyltransferase